MWFPILEKYSVISGVSSGSWELQLRYRSRSRVVFEPNDFYFFENCVDITSVCKRGRPRALTSHFIDIANTKFWEQKVIRSNALTYYLPVHILWLYVDFVLNFRGQMGQLILLQSPAEGKLSFQCIFPAPNGFLVPTLDSSPQRNFGKETTRISGRKSRTTLQSTFSIFLNPVFPILCT